MTLKSLFTFTLIACRVLLLFTLNSHLTIGLPPHTETNLQTVSHL